MSENIHNKHTDNMARIISVALCGAVFVSTLFIYPHHTVKEDSVTAHAKTNEKEYKWTKQTVSEGTTVNAEYLWPNETNPSFIAVYRDGKLLSDDKMVTIVHGSVYHFRGVSDDSVLYTQVYVDSAYGIDITSGETGTWYHLLPSSIRNEFEESGWTWETGWEYTGRAYLDLENSRIMIKNDDHTAVLYGMGLYLDDKNNYSSDIVFEEEGSSFIEVFGDVDNLFAYALEYYYTRGGELRSKCPGIYAMVANAMSQMDGEITQIEDTVQEETQSGPGLMIDLLDYVNAKRDEAGLSAVAWDKEDDANVIIRVKEIKGLFSQTRPDGSDAFSAYTDAVMCEMRLEDAYTPENIFECSASYFLMPELISFNCAIYDNVAVLVFVW